jgi:hypothetical protein
MSAKERRLQAGWNYLQDLKARHITLPSIPDTYALGMEAGFREAVEVLRGDHGVDPGWYPYSYEAKKLADWLEAKEKD